MKINTVLLEYCHTLTFMCCLQLLFSTAELSSCKRDHIRLTKPKISTFTEKVCPPCSILGKPCIPATI